MKNERLQERIRQRDFKLKALLDITAAINENLSAEALLQQFKLIVSDQLNIGKAVLFSKIDDQWHCSFQYGVERDYSDLDPVVAFSKIRDIEIVQSSKDDVFGGFDLVIPVFHKAEALSYFLIGDMDDDELRVSPIIKHMRFVQTLTNIISVAIENKTLVKKSLEQERVNTELELAAEMQSLMVGSGTKNYTNFEVATFYMPHQQVGGDFCDFIELNEDEAFFCVADVSGKGVSAAFLMANVQAHLRALLEYTDWTLESIAHELNKKVNNLVKGDRFVTMFMGHYHRPSRTLNYLNAGHNPPVVWNQGEIHLLESGTVGIGMLSQLPFVNRGTIKLHKNAIAVCYTDGVVEIENQEEDEYGYERLGNLMRTQAPDCRHVEDLIEDVMSAVDVHRGINPYFDDTALLCCRFL
jgi:sigma-B regulation protein RsbU (phosphoserine phosphatase)